MRTLSKPSVECPFSSCTVAKRPSFIFRLKKDKEKVRVKNRELFSVQDVLAKMTSTNN